MKYILLKFTILIMLSSSCSGKSPNTNDKDDTATLLTEKITTTPEDIQACVNSLNDFGSGLTDEQIRIVKLYLIKRLPEHVELFKKAVKATMEFYEKQTGNNLLMGNWSDLDLNYFIDNVPEFQNWYDWTQSTNFEKLLLTLNSEDIRYVENNSSVSQEDSYIFFEPYYALASIGGSDMSQLFEKPCMNLQGMSISQIKNYYGH